MLYKKLAKPILFNMDPEDAHHFIIRSMRRAENVPGALSLLHSMYKTEAAPELQTEFLGIHFDHPVGLAAGLDKNGEAVPAFSSVGFSFMEVGTVTPVPQPGNERPRLFRLPEDEALINRMGFNNQGAEAMAVHLQKVKNSKIPIAVNIGKNKTTPNEQAVDDYRACMEKLYAYGDLFVVNISSPNTPDLRKLQHGESLRQLLTAVTNEVRKQAGKADPKPVLVKIAPDLTEQELDDMLDTVLQTDISGIIATNTTISREGLQSAHRNETGGLSGEPLKQRSVEVIRQICRRTEGKLPIIGVGGIFNGQDAYAKIKAGASLVEIYSALIYHGPGIVRDIHKQLLECLKQDGFTHISQAVGVEAHKG